MGSGSIPVAPGFTVLLCLTFVLSYPVFRLCRNSLLTPYFDDTFSRLWVLGAGVHGLECRVSHPRSGVKS
jgi:hypothetical protein